MSEPVCISQHKRGEYTWFTFTDDAIEYRIKDKTKGEFTVHAPYTLIGAEDEYRHWREKNRSVAFVTYICLLVGVFQITKRQPSASVVLTVLTVCLGIWAVFALLGVLIAPFFLRSYVSVPVPSFGNLVVLDDAHRDRILAEIGKRRTNALRERYACIDPAQPLQREVHKFIWLLDQNLISQAEFDIFMQRLEISPEAASRLSLKPVAVHQPDAVYTLALSPFEKIELKFTPERLDYKTRDEQFSTSYLGIARPQSFSHKVSRDRHLQIYALALSVVIVAALYVLLPELWEGSAAVPGLQGLALIAVPGILFYVLVDRFVITQRSIIIPSDVRPIILPDSPAAKPVLAEIAARCAGHEPPVTATEDLKDQELAIKVAQIRQLQATGVIDEEEAESLIARTQEAAADAQNPAPRPGSKLH